MKIIGCNERWYMPETSPDWGNGKHLVCVCTVLVAGEADDYAAYQGIGSKEHVARYGDKVSFAEACCHFPGGQLEESRYRL
jgi:hypothetical protein